MGKENLQVFNESDVSFEAEDHDSFDKNASFETIEDQYNGTPVESQSNIAEKCCRAENQLKRNSGESYTTMKGQVVPARSLKRLKDCKRKCHLHISYDN